MGDAATFLVSIDLVANSGALPDDGEVEALIYKNLQAFVPARAIRVEVHHRAETAEDMVDVVRRGTGSIRKDEIYYAVFSNDSGGCLARGPYSLSKASEERKVNGDLVCTKTEKELEAGSGVWYTHYETVTDKSWLFEWENKENSPYAWRAATTPRSIVDLATRRVVE